jgi:uncharacterized protein with HEPN domain
MWNKDKQNLMGILEAIEKIEEYVSPFTTADEFFVHNISLYVLKTKGKINDRRARIG